MNNKEQARIPAATTDAGQTPVEKLEALGVVGGILWRLAGDGQLIDVRCEMPQCYCPRGRRYFEPRSPGADWMPTADHYPRLKMHGGLLTPDNVRLAHRVCDQRHYLWRTRINAMLGKRMSLEEIADQLNVKKVPRFTARTDGQLHLFGRHSFPRSGRPGAGRDDASATQAARRVWPCSAGPRDQRAGAVF